MRVLVTGGAGFIGSHVVDELLADGNEVTVLDALLPAAWGRDAARPAYLDARARWVPGDVRDEPLVKSVLGGVDAICHQAAMVGLGVDIRDIADYVGVNELGTATLLRAAAGAGIGRLVLASSMVVYGEGRYLCVEHGSVRPSPRTETNIAAGFFEPTCSACDRFVSWATVDEEAPLDPRSVYAATKVAQENICRIWGRTTGASVTALRYHNVYGPRMPRDTPYAGVASIFRSSLERGDAPRVFEDGGQMRDFVHVRDVAHANILALQRDSEGVFNVASGVATSVASMARRLSTAMDGPEPVITGEFRLGDVRHVVASAERARVDLGFAAQVRFEDGMREFADAPLRGADAAPS